MSKKSKSKAKNANKSNKVKSGNRNENAEGSVKVYDKKVNSEKNKNGDKNKKENVNIDDKKSSSEKTKKKNASNKEKDIVKSKDTEISDTKNPLKLNDSSENKKDINNNVAKDKKNADNGKLKKILTIGGIALASIAIPNYMKSLIEKCEGRAYPGQFVESVDVTGFTEDDVRYVIDEIEKQAKATSLSLKVGENSYKESMEALNFSVSNKEELVKEIMALDKDKSFVEKGLTLVKSELFNLFDKKVYDIKFSYNEEVLNELIDKVKSENDKKKRELNIIKLEDGTYKEIPASNGLEIDESKIKESIVNTIDENLTKPKTLDYKAGVVTPKYTKESLNVIDTKLSSYTTSYPTGSGRSRNVELGALRSNVVVFPGETFSLNEMLLERTRANGYKEAPEFSNGKVIQGIGGGVCQVSTTLYGAMLRAGILPTERHPHSMTVSYAPIGLDAAIFGTILDLKFENTLDYPLYLSSYTEGGKITMEFWSNSQALKGVTYQPKSYPKSSLKANAYLYGYDESGQEVYKEYLGQSTYRPKSEKEN